LDFRPELGSLSAISAEIPAAEQDRTDGNDAQEDDEHGDHESVRNCINKKDNS